MIFFDQSFIDSLLTQANWQNYFKKEQNKNFLFGSGNGNNPLPFRNFALRNNNNIDAEYFLEKSKNFFLKENKNYTVIVDNRDKDLLNLIKESNNYQYIGSSERMVRLKQETPINPTLNNLSIKKVNNSYQLNKIYMDSYGYEKFEIDINFPKKLIFSDNVYCLIAFYNKIPVSTAILILNNNNFELDWVGTKKNYQGQGFAMSLLIQILQYSKKSYTYLVSNHKGNNIYKKLGFIKDYEIYFFKSIFTIK